MFVGKDGTPIREELIRDAIVCEDLMEHMVIATQGFLCVKPCASDSSCSVVDRQMEVPGLAGDPFVGGSVHLLHFAEISASGAPGVGIFDCHKIGLDGIGFLLEEAFSFLIRSSFLIRFFLAFVTLGERIDSASSILATEEGEIRMFSRSSRSSV